METTWILTNFAYGDEQDQWKILDSQLEILYNLNQIMQGEDMEFIEQILWFFGNLCGGTLEMRDYVLDRTNLVERLSQLMVSNNLTLSLMRTIIWLGCNILRHKKVNPNDVNFTLLTSILDQEARDDNDCGDDV